MAYTLGVDLGTTFSAAAIAENGRVEIFQLGDRAATIPSVVVLRADGEVLTGEPAERRALSEPTRTAREAKRRLGDPTPIILGGTPYGAEALLAHLLRSIVDQVTQRHGERPAAIVLSHPASYGPYKLDLLRQAVRQADVGEVALVSEPEAAARDYASQERVPAGSVIAVYDFGGGTFDATVLRKRSETGFEQLGAPEGLERLGGIDFDQAVFAHVDEALGGQISRLDPGDARVRAAVARLREECRHVKEALSVDTDAVIPVFLPDLQTEVRITRDEFEAMIRPRVRETIAALERAVRSAGLGMDAVDRVLLVGGSSRIPLVAEMVRDATGRPVAVDAHPKHAIALGAARMAADRLGAGAQPDEVPPPIEAAVAAVPPPPAATPPPLPEATLPPPARPASARRRGVPNAPALAALAVVAVLVSSAIAMAAFGSAGSPTLPPLVGGDTTASPALPTGPAAPTTGSPVTPAAPPTATVEPAPPTPIPSPTPRFASQIRRISIDNGRYVVDFTTTGYEPSLPGRHVHFFFDTVPPGEAGSPGKGPWFVYGGESPFTGYGVSDRPAGANQMCILVARSDHSVIRNTGNCVDLPG